jgi:hypothetical protein
MKRLRLIGKWLALFGVYCLLGVIGAVIITLAKHAEFNLLPILITGVLCGLGLTVGHAVHNFQQRNPRKH